MKIVWDEAKRAANLDKHGFDLARFEQLRFVVVLSAEPSRGRSRVRVVGYLGRDLVCAIVSPLGSEATSVISLRGASEKERIAHDER